MRITGATAREIADSRGDPTVAVELWTEAGTFCAKVPSGKSRGKEEDTVLPPAQARAAAEAFSAFAAGKSVSSVREFDALMCAFDSSKHFERLGGNVSIGLSLAAARARAGEEKCEMWEALRGEFFPHASDESPRIFSNLVNGGAHAKNNLSVQEHMVVTPRGAPPRETIRALQALYRALGERLREETPGAPLAQGDEGGYSLSFEDARAPIEALAELSAGEKTGGAWEVALDAAASSFFDAESKTYALGGKKLFAEELRDWYASIAASASLFSIEDPFDEGALDDFTALQHTLPNVRVIGDDLTVTDEQRIEGAAKAGAIKGVIIKPNQTGTLTDTCAAIAAARRANLFVICSHRSGETGDPFIIELARACGADGVKIGAPHALRMALYNELIRLYSL